MRHAGKEKDWKDERERGDIERNGGDEQRDRAKRALTSVQGFTYLVSRESQRVLLLKANVEEKFLSYGGITARGGGGGWVSMSDSKDAFDVGNNHEN